MINLIEPPSWNIISNFEIEMVGESDGEISIIIDPEDCVTYDRVFWSVYQRYDPELAPDGFRGAMCIADCDHHEEAKVLLDNFREVLEALKIIHNTTKNIINGRELMDHNLPF